MHKDQLLHLLLHCCFSIAIQKNECTTFCGEVDIRTTFQLKGEKGCGDQNYELTCRNNHTILDLYSREYYVQYINYINFTIRLANVGLQKANCSPLPHRSLSCSDFSFYPIGIDVGNMKKGPTLSKTLAIVDCMEAVNSLFYIDSSSCLSEVKFSDSSSTRRRVYAMVDVNVSYVEATCTIEHMAMIPWWFDGNNVRSYAQIHELMVYGFELSWLPIACARNCNWCNISDTYKIHCADKKRLPLVYRLCAIRGFDIRLGSPMGDNLAPIHMEEKTLSNESNVEEFLQI
ncbi:uncharacterized protein LOC120289603 [Eucalyptus grandis]|uniref:uncharacterized protein LOC120289603 n=1 Tax=Eucalyptus grandis TaxID=71139 RepID=UPI00192EDB20|nr:uncharacterized protein LOC120289603 [Eucalyptus grandis]